MSYFKVQRGLDHDTILALDLSEDTEKCLFPLHDLLGNPLGSSSRQLDSSLPKYRHPHGFPKKMSLYNIHRAKTHIEKANLCYLMEGFFDVATAWRKGYKNSVSCFGTSFSDFQARIIKNYCDNIIIVMDGDEAGKEAAVRAAKTAKAMGLNVFRIDLQGDDPDSIIKKNPDEWERLIKDPVHVSGPCKKRIERVSDERLFEDINFIYWLEKNGFHERIINENEAIFIFQDELYELCIDHLSNPDEPEKSKSKFETLLKKLKYMKRNFEKLDIEKAKLYSILELAKSLSDGTENISFERNIKCFFHDDKTASMKLYENNSFYCFGCGVGGDTIDMFSLRQGIGFIEAVKWLSNH